MSNSNGLHDLHHVSMKQMKAIRNPVISFFTDNAKVYSPAALNNLKD
jgi:hypothetical protein